MRIMIMIEDELVDGLKEELGIEDVDALVNRALLEMRQRLAVERLIAFGGSDPSAVGAPRRRPPNFINEE